jgi:DNA polymerase elongation subunit (family B)
MASQSNITSSLEPVIFQIIDWIQYNEKSNVDDLNDSNDSNDVNSDDELENELFGSQSNSLDSYKIRLYGRTIDNKSVVVNINNYTPFFYIKVNKDWTDSKIRTLIGCIKSKISNQKLVKGLKSFDVLMRKDLYGFTAYKDFKFVRLVFHNMRSYKAFESFIAKNKISNSILSKYPIKLPLYESNIEPFIRCMHIRKLNACGWVKISKYEPLDVTYSYCGMAIQTDWTNLEPYDSTSIQKFVIASWDIECMSWSGEFPQAIHPEDRENFDLMMKKLIQKVRNSNPKFKYVGEEAIRKEILLNPKSYPDYLNFEFKHSGDPIIQIGNATSYYGESEPFNKTVISLGGCEKVKGLEDVEIKSFKNEKNVLLAWAKLIRDTDPDVITGWNINGFDFQYIYDRVVYFKILDKFSEISRICGEKSEFKEKMLSSSALGDNILKFFDMGGRIVIDMMKERQREAKLDSYKLDFVASTYIKEKMSMCEIISETKSIIYTSSVYGIKADDYINITWDDGLNENKHDSKYKITELEKVEADEITQLTKAIESYEKYSDYVIKKPKSLYKLVLDGKIPEEIFEIEEGNEPMWKNVGRKFVVGEKKIKSKLYFQIDGYAEKNPDNDDNNGEDTPQSWIDIKYDESIIPIRGNKIFWAHAKDDISPKELFRLYKGSDADRGIIAKYCIMDCVLVTKLMEKLKVLNNNIGMANVCGVPLNYIFMRGQGVKIFSLVSKKCRELGFLIPKKTPDDNKKKKGKEPEPFDPAHPHKNYKKANDVSDDDDSDEEKVGYEGATVFPPVKGIHYEPIPVLDYASLYPSSMIYMNISHECYVNNPAYDNLPDYEYKEAVYNNSDGTTTTCRFAKKKDGTKGVLCQILEELLKKRKETKKLMAAAEAEGNYFLAAIYDGLQLAYKITANSLYGQVGAPTSPIYMKELAASTTATGRKMLELARDFIEGTFGEIVNLCLNDKEEYYKFMKDLFKDVPPHKFVEPKANRKIMMDYIDYFYSRTNQLLNSNYKVKPRVIYGDSVTPDTPILLLNTSGNVEIKTIEEIGKDWEDYSQFKSDIPGLTDKQQDPNINYKVWTDKGWANIKRVIRHKTNKKIYEVVTPQAYVKVTTDHSLLDSEGNQIKPTDCVIGTRLLHNREFEGFKKIYGEEPKEYIDYYIEKYGYHPNSQGSINFTFNNMNDASSMYYACRACGYYVSINILKSNSNSNIFEIKSDKIRPKDYDDYNKITEINDLGFVDDYVYDLETDVGHFHAGVGSLIVKNTDSVFFSPKIHNIHTKQIMTNKACLRVSIELGILAGEVIGKILPEPEDLEYEKTFWPFIILTKKRYVGNLYETDFESFKQKSMGIVLKRRDNAKIVKIVVGGIVDYILNGKFGDTNVTNRNKGAITYTRTLLKKILQGKYPIDKYIITKTLRANYKGTKMTDDEKGEQGQKGSWYWEDVNCPLAHVTLCQRIAKRNPGNKPESNDRIPYVYVIPNGKVKLQADRIEDPKYVMEKQIELDYQFYITNQIMKPALQFLEHIATSPEKIFENYINKEINRRKKTDPINNYIGEQCVNSNSDSDSDSDTNNKSNKDIKITKKSTKEVSKKDTSYNKKNKDDDRLINKLKTNVKQSLTINI